MTFFERAGRFVRESREELSRVNWPGRKETTRYTTFVIGFSVALSLFLGLLDFLFLQGLERFILN